MKTDSGAGYAGKITWHSSGEDEGPDVGVSIELADGSELWAGEITRRAWEAAGDDAEALGSDGGWWLMHYTKEGPRVLAKLINDDAAHYLVEVVSALLRPKDAGARPPAVRVTPQMIHAAARELEQRIHYATPLPQDTWLRIAGAALEAGLAVSFHIQQDWQPIASAPKDGTKILACREGGRVSIWRWSDDRYAKQPRPFWSSMNSKTTDRANQPTHWMPLPAPPDSQDADK